MTKMKQTLTMPEPIRGFDVLKWKQETQAKIYQETKNMTTEEVLEYFRRGSEEFREEQKRRRAERASGISK